MSDSQLLSEASVQTIQLELIRRRRFNQFDGRKIYDSLLQHRDLWISVFMTMPQMTVGDDKMQFLSLVPLRDLPTNRWNVDTMYVLCKSVVNASRLREAAQEEKWEFDSDEILTAEVANKALGVFPSDGAVLELWWD